MTRPQAQAEAWRRWGADGVVTMATQRRTRGAKYEVSAYTERPNARIRYGASDESWEAAFTDADKRAALDAAGTDGR